MKIRHKLVQITPFLIRHAMARNTEPYERILQYVRARDDIWIVSQGQYMRWWDKRDKTSSTISVTDGECRVQTSLEGSVIEKFPGVFLDSTSYPVPDATFSGEVWITINPDVEQRDLLIELLKREGIFNIRVDSQGKFMLTQAEVGAVLNEIYERMSSGQIKPLELLVRQISQLVLDKLAVYNLPLLRVWYHPRLNGRIMRAAFSVRYDVDRAITNLAAIRAIEEKYDVFSTLYIRVACPFYSDEVIKDLASKSWCPEIALHGEFVNHANKAGNEMKAALQDKRHLECLIGRPLLGVSMHGGEMVFNRNQNTNQAVQASGLLYDTTLGPTTYYFPFKKIVQREIGSSYEFPHAMSDVSLFPFRPDNKIVNGKELRSYNFNKILQQINEAPVREYEQTFYEKAVAKMDEIYEQGGTFVLTMHPAYFGFWTYLIRPGNWMSLAKYSFSYLK